MLKVFVSHSSKDKDKIEQFVIALERLGCEVFYSSKAHTNSIEFGENFYHRIKKEIRGSDYVFAMVSLNFYDSIPSQIEIGMAYALNKQIKPIAVEKINYNKLLKGLFNSNDRLASIFSKEDMISILGIFSKEVSKIINCTDSIIEKNKEFENIGEIPENEISVTSDTQNYIEELILSGQLNTNECLFLKYIAYKRRFRFEWAWRTKEGVERFNKWLESKRYYVEDEVEEVYKDIINHFNDLHLLEEIEFTSEGNVRIYGLKPIYAQQLVNSCNENSEIIESECNKQYELPF